MHLETTRFRWEPVYDSHTRLMTYDAHMEMPLSIPKRVYEYNPWTRTLMKTGSKGPEMNGKPGPRARKLRGEKRRKADRYKGR